MLGNQNVYKKSTNLIIILKVKEGVTEMQKY